MSDDSNVKQVNKNYEFGIGLGFKYPIFDNVKDVLDGVVSVDGRYVIPVDYDSSIGIGGHLEGSIGGNKFNDDYNRKEISSNHQTFNVWEGSHVKYDLYLGPEVGFSTCKNLFSVRFSVGPRLLWLQGYRERSSIDIISEPYSNELASDPSYKRDGDKLYKKTKVVNEHTSLDNFDVSARIMFELSFGIGEHAEIYTNTNLMGTASERNISIGSGLRLMF